MIMPKRALEIKNLQNNQPQTTPLDSSPTATRP
jgi:hypothetical protein